MMFADSITDRCAIQNEMMDQVTVTVKCGKQGVKHVSMTTTVMHDETPELAMRRCQLYCESYIKSLG